jgi:hypothetical protein
VSKQSGTFGKVSVKHDDELSFIHALSCRGDRQHDIIVAVEVKLLDLVSIRAVRVADGEEELLEQSYPSAPSQWLTTH